MRIKDGIPPTGHVHFTETKSVVVTCISPTSDSYLKLVLSGPCSTRLLCLDPVNPSSGSASHNLKVPYKAYGPWKSPQYRQSLPKNVAKIHSSTPSTRTIALASGVDRLCKVCCAQLYAEEVANPIIGSLLLYPLYCAPGEQHVPRILTIPRVIRFHIGPSGDRNTRPKPLAYRTWLSHRSRCQRSFPFLSREFGVKDRISRIPVHWRFLEDKKTVATQVLLRTRHPPSFRPATVRFEP